MQYYYYVELKLTNLYESNQVEKLSEKLSEIESLAISKYSSTGIEDFSIEEIKVDEILGDRSYSGADIPISVIEEVEHTVNTESGNTKKVYFSAKPQAIDFMNYLKNIKGCEFSLAQQVVEDWNESWRESYKPIVVSDNFEIIPAWNKEDYQTQADHKLYIYPGMGFGTGSHETTFLCMQLLLDINYFPKDVTCLDFGCGSGILGLGLKRLQRDCQIDLYDIDQEALDNCNQNIELNDFEMKGIKLLLPVDRQEINKKYNIVFANILKNVLELEINFLTQSVHQGGSLILSGLLKEQEEDIIDQYLRANNKLKLNKVARSGDWIAILFNHL
jgi:ribosomal protein L11 methyltransferase